MPTPKGFKHSEETKEKIRLAHIGRVFSKEHRLNIGKAKKGIPSPNKGRKTGIVTAGAFKKGHIPWNIGDTPALKGVNSGEKHGLWKGEKASYRAIHHWLDYNYGKAIKCERNNEHQSNIYYWCNISGKYKRDITDWEMLCPKCSKESDKDRKGIIEKRFGVKTSWTHKSKKR